MIAELLTQPLVISSRALSGDIDEYGNDLYHETMVKVNGLIQQQGRREREGFVPEGIWMAFLPAGTPVVADDTIIAENETYKVSGPPWSAYNPLTKKVSHMEATIERTAGGLEESS